MSEGHGVSVYCSVYCDVIKSQSPGVVKESLLQTGVGQAVLIEVELVSEELSTTV